MYLILLTPFSLQRKKFGDDNTTIVVNQQYEIISTIHKSNEQVVVNYENKNPNISQRVPENNGIDHRYRIVDMKLTIGFIEKHCKCTCNSSIKFVHDGKFYVDFICTSCKQIIRWDLSRKIGKKQEVKSKIAASASLAGIDEIEFRR